MQASATKDGPSVDVIVIGAGGAGLSAALVAATQGCTVLVCEKTAQVGGTSARSSGGIWVPGHARSSAAAAADIETTRTYLHELLGSSGASMRDVYLRAAPLAMRYLEQHSAVRFGQLAHPDYRELPGASRTGRSFGALPFDGRKLGRDFSSLAPPLPALVALGGMMVGRADIPHLLHPLGSRESFLATTRLLWRHLRDRLRHSRGTRLLMGNALMAALFYSVRERGVTVWRQTEAVDLLKEDGRVVGAVLKKDGQLHRVRASKGVILATGGFSHSPQWRDKLMGTAERKALSLASEGSTGDGLTLAERCGGEVRRGDLSNACVWAPVSVLARPGRAPMLYPHLFLDRPKPGFIAVDGRGRRFTNEANSYHDFVAGMLRSPRPAQEGRAWLICDGDALQRYGIGMVLPGRRNLRSLAKAGYVTLGNSVEDLAARLGIDAEGLKQEMERHGSFAESGLDADFGKGGSHFNRAHGDPAITPNPCLGPLRNAPFAAVELRPADLSTFAGVSTNADAQVLDASGDVIQGLYACGNDMASIWGGEAPGPGVTLGPAIVFGWCAAMHIAGADLKPHRPSAEHTASPALTEPEPAPTLLHQES